MNILIVGAGGFIGSHLCEEITNNHKDWNVSALDISSTKIDHLLNSDNLTFRKCNILTEHEILDQCVKNCDVVFPLAAIASPLVYVQDPLRVFELDFEANINIVRLAAKYNKRIIFPSTSEVYGMCDDKQFEEESSNCVTGPICKQRWIYSCSKQMLDRVIYAYGIRDGLNYTLFRPFNWIGSRLDDINNSASGSSRVVTQFLSNILHTKDIKLVDGGRQVRCFTYITDAIDALIKIIENKNNCAHQQIFNIGNPFNEVSIHDLAHKIVEIAKNYPKLVSSLANVKIINEDAAKYYGKSYQDVFKRVPSISKAMDLLNWKPVVGIDELLTDTMDFYFK